MKVPSEAELIEIENRGLRLIADSERKIQRAMGSSPGFADKRDLDEWEKHREDFKLLIALARNPSKILRDNPDDEVADRALRAFQPPRTAKPKPVPSFAPKHKKGKSN